MEKKPLEASKWIELPLLLSVEEMRDLLDTLKPIFLYSISRPLSKLNTLDDFLAEYAQYVEALQKGALPKSLQAYVLTSSFDTLFTDSLSEDKFIVRALLPSIFVRPHHFIFSPLDKKFRSKVYGENAITWGYTFSYPQFCIDPITKDAAKVDESYVNTALFRTIQKWVREHTTPTPFLYAGEKINAPIRLGKGCLAFIQNHPQLRKEHLDVCS